MFTAGDTLFLDRSSLCFQSHCIIPLRHGGRSSYSIVVVRLACSADVVFRFVDYFPADWLVFYGKNC
jgi:hypothetical protein